MIPVQGIFAVAQATHARAMEQLAAMHELVVAKHLAACLTGDDAVPFHDAAPHVVDLKTRRTLCNFPLSGCQVCDRIILPYLDKRFDILIPSLGCTQPCETCRDRFGEDAYDEQYQMLVDHQAVVLLADPQEQEEPKEPVPEVLRISASSLFYQRPAEIGPNTSA